MRSYLFLLFILLPFSSGHTRAANTVGCGSVISESGLIGLNHLHYQSDRYFSGHCYFNAGMRPGKYTWFPALPSLSWQRAYVTTVSRSKWDAALSDYQFDWPWLRFSDFSMHLLLQYQEQTLVSKLSGITLWKPTNQIITAEQAVIVTALSTHNGLALEVFRPSNDVNRITFLWHTQRQPLSVRQQFPAPADILTPVDLEWFTFGLENNKPTAGWSSPWQVQLGQGKARDNGVSFLSQQNINTRFNYLKLSLSPGYRWRWSRTLGGYLAYQLDWQYLDFANTYKQHNYQIPDTSRISQRLALSFEWRF